MLHIFYIHSSVTGFGSLSCIILDLYLFFLIFTWKMIICRRNQWQAGKISVSFSKSASFISKFQIWKVRYMIRSRCRCRPCRRCTPFKIRVPNVFTVPGTYYFILPQMFVELPLVGAFPQSTWTIVIHADIPSAQPWVTLRTLLSHWQLSLIHI